MIEGATDATTLFVADATYVFFCLRSFLWKGPAELEGPLVCFRLLKFSSLARDALLFATVHFGKGFQK